MTAVIQDTQSLIENAKKFLAIKASWWLSRDGEDIVKSDGYLALM